MPEFEARVWDRFYDEVIYLSAREGELILTLPDGELFPVGIEQVKTFRKALQRYERIHSKEGDE